MPRRQNLHAAIFAHRHEDKVAASRNPTISVDLAVQMIASPPTTPS
jgi:hypothetical protein